MSVLSTDVLIVGAGPVGLFAAFSCGMVRLSAVVVDALEAVGGQCSALYPEKPIYDIPGHPRITGQELIDRLVEQAAPFVPAYRLNRRIESLTRGEDGRWLAGTSAGEAIDAAAVIVAAGAGAFGPNRPPLANLAEFEGKSVFYMVRRREDFRGRRVVIAGGGDSAVDWAVSLAEVASEVHVVHRRPKFRAAPESENRLHELAAAGKVDLVVPYRLAGLVGKSGVLEAVAVENLDGGRREIPADVLLPFFGLAASLGPIADWGLDVVGRTVAVDPATSATSAPGIFAAGDICSYPGKLKLILTGFAEAARAAHAAHDVARPDRPLHHRHSTDTGVPGL